MFASPAAEAKLRGPTGLTVNFGRGIAHGLAKVSWNRVPGATKYMLEISRRGFYGPWVPHVTKRPSEIISYRDFPYRTAKSRAPYILQVRAFKNGSWGSASSRIMRTRVAGRGVSVKKPAKASKKMSDCLKVGLAAGITTATSTGLVRLAAVWIPGLNALTGAQIAATSASAAVSAGVYCLVPWQ